MGALPHHITCVARPCDVCRRGVTREGGALKNAPPYRIYDRFRGVTRGSRMTWLGRDRTFISRARVNLGVYTEFDPANWDRDLTGLHDVEATSHEQHLASPVSFVLSNIHSFSRP